MRQVFLFVLMLMIPPLVSSQSIYQRAIAAYQAGDTTTMLALSEQALAEQPASPLYAYLAAVALAANDRNAEAIAKLQTVAERGISLGAAREPGFSEMATLPAFKAVIARFEQLNQPYGQVQVIARHHVGDFVPEGLAILSDGTVLLGSVRHQRIDRIPPDGEIEVWIESGTGGLRSAFGMRADEASNKLWVASSAMAEAADIDTADIGKAGVLLFDLANGEPLARYDAPGAPARVLGDLVIQAPMVYATDSLTGEVLALDTTNGRWTTLVPSGSLISPQGLALSPNGHYLLVADYRTGFHRVNLETHERVQLVEPAAVSAHGIDGLYWYGERTLLATRNGFRPNGALQFELSDNYLKIESVRLLAGALELFDDPTLGQVVGDQFVFIANSHWPQFDAEKNLPPAETLSPPLIVSVPIVE